MKLVFAGGGGHCRSCMVVAERRGLEVLGVLDPVAKGDVLGRPILGDDEWVAEHGRDSGIHFLVTVGMVRDAQLRRTIFGRLVGAGVQMATLSAVSASVSRDSELGIGSVAMEHAHIGPSARVGLNSIINTGAIVEHDAVIGDHCHISTGALVNGGARIGDGCMVGSGAVVLQGISVADNVIVGAGATVVRDIHEPGVWAGAPARRIK